MDAFDYLKLVSQGKKSFQNKDDFNEFLNLDLDIRKNDHTPTMSIILNNLTLSYNLTPKQIIQICEKSNINSLDFDRWNYLHYILTFNKNQALNLTNKAILSLLEKVDLIQTTPPKDKYYLQYLLDFNPTEELWFTQEQLIKIYEKTLLKFNEKNMPQEKHLFIKKITKASPYLISMHKSYLEKQELYYFINQKKAIKNRI